MITNNSIAAVNAQAIKQPESKFLNFLSFLPFEIFNRSKNVVSVLRLEGVIGRGSMGKSGLTLDSMEDKIEKAFKPKRLLAVCLIINSPGGLPVQAELIAARIRALAEEKSVPVYSFIEDIAASGGYWLACAGDEVYASKSSIVGSIGVISSSFGLHKAIEKFGIERRVYSQGDNKSVLDPFLPAKDEDIQIIKNVQGQIYDHFVEYVKSRRKGKLTQTDSVLFNGAFWGGQSAVDFGLVDGIDILHNFIKNKFGSDVHINYIKAKESLIKKYISSKLSSDIVGSIKEQLIYDKFNL
jgi:signal peptide peptidase SppA